MWAFTAAYIAFGRDYAKLAKRKLVNQEVYDKYEPWETLARLSGYRFLHKEFCIISDRPVEFHIDENNQPHCESGPYIRWSDGSAFYAWHGTFVSACWIETPDSVDPVEVIKTENVEQRAAGCAILGWDRMLDHLPHKILDSEENPEHGDLIEVTLPGLSEPGLFLKAKCPRNGWIFEGVKRINDIDGKPITTVKAAHAWRWRESVDEFEYPPIRT